MFFSKFSTIEYNDKTIRDLSQAIVIRPEIKENKDLYFYYQLQEYELPDTVAFDFYGSSHLNYVVLLMNDIVDPFYDWPLNRKELVELCIARYGEPGIVGGQFDETGYFAVRHWEKDGIEYQTGLQPVGAAAVSYYEYEERRNDAKRKIKILYPEYIPQMQKELDTLLNG